MCCACGGGIQGQAPSPTPTPTSSPSPTPQACQSTDNGAKDAYGDVCENYVGNQLWCGAYDDDDFKSSEMCCACGGGIQGQAPSPTPTPTSSPSPTPQACQSTDNGAKDAYGDVC